MTDPTITAEFDPALCPGTWPQLVGHLHTCTRTVGHRGQCECLCGSMADSVQMEPTTTKETTA